MPMSGRLCDTHTEHFPLAYSVLSLGTGGAWGRSQQLASPSTMMVPSGRVISLPGDLVFMLVENR